MNQPHVSENQMLRYRRLAFYAQDIDQFNDLLNSFIKKSSARCALLIDRDGHTVTKQGFLDNIDSSSLAALVSGSFASTREVAKQLGETEFSVMFQQGPQQSIHIHLVGERTLQVCIFDNSVKPGLIQVLTRELAGKLESLLDGIADRSEQEGDSSPNLETGFSDEMQDPTRQSLW